MNSSTSKAMTRFHIYLSQQQRKRLDAESRKTGIPVAELIRRKIDAGESKPIHFRLHASLLHKMMIACFPEELGDAATDEEISGVVMNLLDRLYRWTH